LPIRCCGRPLARSILYFIAAYFFVFAPRVRRHSREYLRRALGREPTARDRFRQVFNEERPHQALNMQTPSSCYAPSPRPYPARVAEPEYGSALVVRRVDCTGHLSWKHESVFLTEALSGERVGLWPLDDRYYGVYFGEFPLARFDSYRLRIERLTAGEALPRES